nr:sulfurtransferase TusA family protein [uncultured Dethiosulfovibrio sp.]
MSDFTVDARGLSCPQPVMETKKALEKAAKGKVTVLVDTETARNNVDRFGKSKGWNSTCESTSDGYKITFSR